MGHYRKKPIVVEAIQWDGSEESQREVRLWARPRVIEGFFGSTGTTVHGRPIDGYFLSIRTLEGEMKALPGDWIIRGVQGELYPCKPDIFEATYEPVEEA